VAGSLSSDELGLSQNIEATRASHRVASIGNCRRFGTVAANWMPQRKARSRVSEFFDTMFRRGTSLFQFYRNAAVLNLDLRLWMTELDDFTFSGGLVIGSRFFEEALVLPNDIFFTPWNYFTRRYL
jgi:hypothetical protein